MKHLSKEEYNGRTAALIVGGKNVSPFHVSKNIFNVFQIKAVLVHARFPPHNEPLSLHLSGGP